MPQTCFDDDASKKDLRVYPFRYYFIRSHTSNRKYKNHESAPIQVMFEEMCTSGAGVMPTLARVHTGHQTFTPKSMKNDGRRQPKETNPKEVARVLPAFPAYS